MVPSVRTGTGPPLPRAYPRPLSKRLTSENPLTGSMARAAASAAAARTIMAASAGRPERISMAALRSDSRCAISQS